MLTFLLVSCGPDPVDDTVVDPGWLPEVFCPGGPQCSNADGDLKAAAGVVSILPTCWETWDDASADQSFSPSDDTFFDCGCDQRCAGDPGWSGMDDGEGDGVFQAVWMAGFGTGRAATGIRDATLGLRGEGDGLDARVLLLAQGDTVLALVTMDVVGFMYDDVLALRAQVDEAGIDVDHVLVHSSHGHEGPDTMGIYGPSIIVSGYDPAYTAQIRADVVATLVTLSSALVPVHMEVGESNANDYADNGVGNLIHDTRDPNIVDPRIGTARFVDDDGNSVATLVHWANHPETVASNNTLLTSDFVHALRETVETGSFWDGAGAPGVGGVALYLNGTVGGMMTSLGAHVVDPLGNTWSEASFEKADAVGQLVGEMALDAVATAVPSDVSLRFGAQSFFVPVDNNAFQAMFLLGVLAHRKAYNYDPERPLSESNRPEVQSEVDVVQLGDLTLFTLPGEPLPELVIGGYDGSFTPPGELLLDPDNINPPDLLSAPPGPYLADLFTTPHVWAIGLGNDEVGYIIPPYNFEVPEAGGYILESEGDHYEETNSLGATTADLVTDPLNSLADWAARPAR